MVLEHGGPPNNQTMPGLLSMANLAMQGRLDVCVSLTLAYDCGASHNLPDHHKDRPHVSALAHTAVTIHCTDNKVAQLCLVRLQQNALGLDTLQRKILKIQQH